MPKSLTTTLAWIVFAVPPLALYTAHSLLGILLFSPFALALLIPLVIAVVNRKYPERLPLRMSWLQAMLLTTWGFLGLCFLAARGPRGDLYALPIRILDALGVSLTPATVWGQMIFFGALLFSLITAVFVLVQAHTDKPAHKGR